MVDLLGAWSLLSCVNMRDGEETRTFGDPPSGQLQYTADGRMSAFLMDPAWAARGDTTADSFTEFFAYAGTWRREGDRVHHDIAFSSVPTRVGTSFTRIVKVIDADRIVLETEPEVSKSGRTYVTVLAWQRASLS
ncbi:lipocalin-like domain-containing protein [Sphingomonas sp. TZW2008]|uniref:lipocalin-like domain-containing protein n=1 Tax=Sphingomonas sp. TZW2008 TaxID=1917973 RepID=UPI000A26BF8D|nr:lipocalin-like domain-containing protein [Sphingomonas sp. TZW2008]